MMAITNVRDALYHAPLVGKITDGLITNVDEVDANNTYVGVAVVGTADGTAEWQIKKVAKSGNVTKIRFADGSLQFNKEWDERATYTYA